MPLLWLLTGVVTTFLLFYDPGMTSSTAGQLRLHPGCRDAALSGCLCSASPPAGLSVRCSGLGLAAVPHGFPNATRRLYLDGNLLTSVPADAFAGLPLLAELDLSRNQIASLDPGSFRGLAPTLRSLDLSHNRLTSLEPGALGGLRAQANLTLNPWHCDCRMQVAMPQLDLDPASLAGVVCHTSEPDEVGARGVALVMLASELDLCAVSKRTTDMAMLVTMFSWFAMVITYLVYYVRHNQEDTRRHLEYLKSLPSRQTSTLSTMV